MVGDNIADFAGDGAVGGVALSTLIGVIGESSSACEATHAMSAVQKYGATQAMSVRLLSMTIPSSDQLKTGSTAGASVGNAFGMRVQRS